MEKLEDQSITVKLIGGEFITGTMEGYLHYNFTHPMLKVRMDTRVFFIPWTSIVFIIEGG